MNGLCPACRRRYDDQSIEWKIVSPEEQKADIALQARKKALARKKETEQRQVETNNRKHLAGLRVVQKNLVYVVGLSQQSSEEEFLKTLRGDQYFGQYGKIIKIVVSKAKAGSSSDNNSIGVYVTFEKREDAARCIAAVDGSRNLERPLRYVRLFADATLTDVGCRAQYGTTKYCSAYLRHETCGNRNCTFLHEIGQDYDSFSRQDLSSMNAMSTQRPAGQAQASSSNPPPPQSQPPAQQAPQTITAALQQTARDEAGSRSDNDGPALPSSANWAAKPAQSEAARSSKAASVATPSPVVTSSNLATQLAEPSPVSKSAEPESHESQSQSQPQQQPAVTSSPPEPPTRPPAPVEEDLKTTLTRKLIAQKDVFSNWTFNTSLYTEEQLKEIYAFPNLIDDQGGLKRYLAEKEQERERLKQEEERNVLGAMSTAEEDENRVSGSLQLGGEPDIEETISEQMGRLRGQNRSTTQATIASPSNQFSFAGSAFQPSNIGNLSRTLTPQQREQLSLLQRGGSTRQSPISQTPFQQGYGQASSLHQHQTSNPFQNQLQAPGGFGSAQGHARQASRYTFSSDSSMNPAAVKPAANPQLAAQQAGALPATHNKQFQGQQFPQASAPNFYSGVQGPPPGLKSSGTPPINGSGMFGQGHGFASAMGGSAGFGGNMGNKNNHDDAMQQLLRSRERGGNGQGAADFGKRELKFPFSSQQHTNPESTSSSLLNTFYGSQLGSSQGFQDQNLQKQKKKGKKHRHANTSSSGGGGIVDDPSILQARMHHGGMGSQFGPQGQGAFNNAGGAIYGGGYNNRW